MRKLGVIVFLSLLTLSSLILISNLNLTADNYKSDNNQDDLNNIIDKENPPLTSDDSFEPNDYFSQSYEIYPNYYSSLSCEDEDWYKIWMDYGQEFIIDIYFVHNPPLQGDLDIELRDHFNSYLTGSYSVTDNEHIEWTADYSGFYYIKVYNLTYSNTYDLDIIIDDKFENNDVFGMSSETYKGFHRGLYCKDDDYYKIDVDYGEQVNVKIFYDQYNGDIDLELYNLSYGFIGRSDNWNKDYDELSFTAGYSGFYYIRVYPKVVSYRNWYDMKVGNPEITIFYEDFEGSLSPRWSGFGGNNYWHVTSYDYSPTNPTHSLWCGNESSYSYEKRENSFLIPYKDSIRITDFDLRDFCYAELTFDYTYFAGMGENVKISAMITGDDYYINPKFSDNLLVIEDNLAMMSVWENYSIDLSFFCGYEHVDIIFSFESDTFDYYDEGLKIDNVKIKGFKDDVLAGTTLGIHEGEEFYYYFPIIDDYTWKYEIFGRDIFNYDNDEIKIEIYKIYDNGFYWDIIARFWDPWDDFDELAGTDEIHYKIYKNPLNIKAGSDFFIPSGNIMKYLDRADNCDWFNEYGIDHWRSTQWDEYHITFDYDDFAVELIYKSNGVLSGMMIWRKPDWRMIFEMWQGDYNDDDDEEEDDEKYRSSIPGYDIVILVSAISVVSVITILRVKKVKKKRFF